jgi:hypothetical protein
MSWGTCYQGSNNIHAGFPALMSDGVIYTDWNSACKSNDILKKQVGITNNYNYRQFLIRNADGIIKKNQIDACERCCGCLENFGKQPQNTGKYIFKSCTDKTQPYGYEHSNLKSLYLTDTALQSRLCAPLLTQEEMLTIPNWN